MFMCYSIVLEFQFSFDNLIITGQRSCNSAFSLQLVRLDESVEGSGRVEICVCSDPVDNSTCYWNTVSTGSDSVPMGWKNSIVVCRQLGYTDVQSPILQNT